MAKLYDLARMTTATTGAGTITLGAAVSGYLTFALAGVANGDTVSYGIKDGANSEIGTGVYTASGTTLTRTPTKSTNGNAAISLSGTAEVFITPRAEDLLTNSSTGTVVGHSIATNGAVATDASGNMPGNSNTIPTNTEGSQLISASITPKNTANILVIEAWLYGDASVSSVMQIAVFQDSTANAIATQFVNPNAFVNSPFLFQVKFSMTAGTTSSTTFKLRFGLDRAGTMTVNGASGSQLGGGVMLSGIEVTEYVT
jgi:hypothetical protein